MIIYFEGDSLTFGVLIRNMVLKFCMLQCKLIIAIAIAIRLLVAIYFLD